MLTVDFDRLGLLPGDRALDLGCGAGRHAFEMYRRGADVVAFDQDAEELARVREMFAAMRAAGEVPAGAEADVKEGDALALPFADGEFDRVVAAEILEHIPDDIEAIAEMVRVLRPGGTLADHRAAGAAGAGLLAALGGATTTSRAATSASTPTSWSAKAANAGLRAHRQAPRPRAALAVLVAEVRGRRRQRHEPGRAAYHRLLVWDIMKRPLRHPGRRADRSTR